MESTRIKALFRLIDYLHSNIGYYNEFNQVFNNITDLTNELKALKPKNNYSDKLKSMELKAKREPLFDLINKEIYKPIFNKVIELDIYNIQIPETMWNWNFAEISEFKNSFDAIDVPELIQQKNKYIEFRTKTKISKFNDLFFNDLDEILKQLFDFFKDSDQDEFKPFEIGLFNEIIQQTETTPGNNTPGNNTPPAKFTGNKLIDIYDPKKVHKEFRNELKCDYNTFKAWFIDSIISDKKMKWNYRNGNKTQLRSFIYWLTYGWKPSETNLAFIISVDSNDREQNLNKDLLQRIEKCKIK